MNSLFIAKFAQVSNGSESFTADKNGNLPFIGTVLAGKAKGTLINGTIFQRENLVVGQLYMCSNTVNPEYPDQYNVEIVSSVSPLEFLQARKDLGEPMLIRPTTTEETAAAVATVEAVDESEVVAD